MDAIVALVVILVVIAIGYFAYSAGKKTCKNDGGGSPTNFGSWYPADWGDIRERALEALRVLRHRYPPASLTDPQGSWDGSVSYRPPGGESPRLL